MAYNKIQLCVQVHRLLSAKPHVTLLTLSRDLGVDRHTLTRALLGVKGIGFRELQRQMQLEKALELLASGPNRSIKEIAVLTGHTSQSAFTRFIRSATRKTPSQIRHELGARSGDWTDVAPR